MVIPSYLPFTVNGNVDTNTRILRKRVEPIDKLDKFPHSPILHYACRSLLTENNGKNNATAVKVCAVFVVSWWENKDYIH